MKTIVIITSRWHSERLPGKALVDIVGKPMLWHIVNRARVAVQNVVVATTPDSQPIIDFCEKEEILYFVGSEEDILDRLYRTAQHYKADVIVRVWGDSPLVDPDVIIAGLKQFNRTKLDYFYTQGLPQGINIAIMPFSTLKKAFLSLMPLHDRLWIHKYFVDHPEIYKTHILKHQLDLSKVDLTVDTEKDLRFVRKIYRELHKNVFRLEEVLNVIGNSTNR